MKYTVAAIFSLIIPISFYAQYYYNDIIGTRDINQMIRLYRNNKVTAAEATGYEDNGAIDNDFSEMHSFFPDQNLLKISTRNKTTVSNEYYRFNSKDLVISVADTSASLSSVTNYSYDDQGHPLLIKNTVTDASDSIYSNEVHQWFYNAAGLPVRMLRIVNSNDTTEVRFTLDEKGNVVEELPFIKKISGEKTYYYYDDKNRLTDIVRFNEKAHRLLPDYMFDYSDKDQVIRKRTTLSAADLGYLIWQYSYNDQGLRITEASFNRNKELIGKIEYSYRFEQ